MVQIQGPCLDFIHEGPEQNRYFALITGFTPVQGMAALSRAWRGIEGSIPLRWAQCAVATAHIRQITSGKDLKRDVEVNKNEKQMVALLRRIADAVETHKSFRISVKGEKLTVPKNAACSVEHERSSFVCPDPCACPSSFVCPDPCPSALTHP